MLLCNLHLLIIIIIIWWKNHICNFKIIFKDVLRLVDCCFMFWNFQKPNPISVEFKKIQKSNPVSVVVWLVIRDGWSGEQWWLKVVRVVIGGGFGVGWCSSEWWLEQWSTIFDDDVFLALKQRYILFIKLFFCRFEF